jgi:hypothetical protein
MGLSGQRVTPAGTQGDRLDDGIEDPRLPARSCIQTGTVCTQLRLPRPAYGTVRLLHEPKRKLLGQCRCRVLLLESHDQTRLAPPVSEPHLRQSRYHRLRGFYNCERVNSALGNLSPVAYEWQIEILEPIVVSEIT